MSNYRAPARHPVTGNVELAEWLDDHFGRHRYADSGELVGVVLFGVERFKT